MKGVSPKKYHSILINNSACNELSDITWIEAIRLLMETFLEVVADKYLLEDDEIESLFETFIAALPDTLRNKLLQCA